MSKQRTFDLPVSLHSGPYIQLEHSLRSEISAISPFVDKLMSLIVKCHCIPGNERDVEVALREALANAIIHGNHKDPRKHIHVSCRCKLDEVLAGRSANGLSQLVGCLNIFQLRLQQ